MIRDRLKFLKRLRYIVFIIAFIIFLYMIQCIYNRKVFLIDEYERLACESLYEEINKVDDSEDNTIYLEGVKIVLGKTSLQEVYDGMIAQDIDFWEDDYSNNFPNFWYNLNWTRHGYPENYGVVRIDKGTYYDVKLYYYSGQYLKPREDLDFSKCYIYGVQIPYYNKNDWEVIYSNINLKEENFESMCELLNLSENDTFYDYFRLYLKNNVFYFKENENEKLIRFWRNNVVDYGYMNKNFDLN